jgi:hypothetical protein
VAIQPGSTLLTWMPREASSVARYFAKPVVAMRATVDSAVPGIS